jgi:hypothetical protein
MKAIWMTLAIAVSLSSVACGGGCKGSCKDASKCDGVTDFDEDDCVDQCEKAEEDAKDADCSKEYDKVFDCMTKDVCDADALSNCADELTDMSTCMAD